MSKKQKTYAEKLKDPQWQKKRLEVMERDKFTCRMCDDKETTLHIHHKIYEQNKNPWECSNNNLITVCEDCHILLEKAKKDGSFDWSEYKVLKLASQIKKERIYLAFIPRASAPNEVFLSICCYADNNLVYSAGLLESHWEKIVAYISKHK